MKIAKKLHVIARGWLHGNVIVLDDERPQVIDTGYLTGADETLELITRQLGSPIDALAVVRLTHVHSDHAGGCARIREMIPHCVITAHPVCCDLLRRWDRAGLWLDGTGQSMDAFDGVEPQEPGSSFRVGGRSWRCVELGGHARGGLGFHCAAEGILVSGDALWRNGLGALRPRVDGEAVFDEAAAALDRIESLSPRLVIPGHGEPFEDVQEALERARGRLARWRASPADQQRNGLRGFLSFWLLANPGGRREEFDAAAQSMVDEMDVLDIAVEMKKFLATGLVTEEGGAVYPGPLLA